MQRKKNSIHTQKSRQVKFFMTSHIILTLINKYNEEGKALLPIFYYDTST